VRLALPERPERWTIKKTIKKRRKSAASQLRLGPSTAGRRLLRLDERLLTNKIMP